MQLTAAGIPLVLAHRGYHPKGVTENSMAAFQAAVAIGADAIETDVHRTRDGQLVLHHDPHLADGRLIAELEYAAIPPLADGTRMPLLGDLIALSQATGKRIVVELKEKGYEADVVSALSRSLPHNQFEIISFNSSSIKAVEALRPQTRTGLLEPHIWEWLRESKVWPFIVHVLDPLHLSTRAAARAGADFLAIDDRTATASLLDDAQRRGLDVNVWTLNTQSSLAKFLGDPRVHSVTTDKPQLAQAIRSALYFPTH